MPERALVHQPRTGTRGHRDMATGVHRGVTEEGARRPDTFNVREAMGSEDGYSNGRALIQTATESGGIV